MELGLLPSRSPILFLFVPLECGGSFQTRVTSCHLPFQVANFIPTFLQSLPPDGFAPPSPIYLLFSGLKILKIHLSTWLASSPPHVSFWSSAPFSWSCVGNWNPIFLGTSPPLKLVFCPPDSKVPDFAGTSPYPCTVTTAFFSFSPPRMDLFPVCDGFPASRSPFVSVDL